jgi:Zn-dependent protease/CBS domain-containing protein
VGRAREAPEEGNMFGRHITLFHLLGFEVKVDLSWVFLALLIAWSLARGFFPATYPGLPAATYWSMGIAGVVGLVVSIVLHELSHSLVARRFDVQIRGITLFIFGGVAEMDGEPGSPRVEFLMAAAGPVASFVLAGAFMVLSGLARDAGLPQSAVGVLAYLALLNTMLAVFNLVPAFPLDGGRMLRAGLWARKGDIAAATRQAARIGGGFGIAMIFLGLMNVIAGRVVSGIWWALIGMFLRAAAQGAYGQVVARGALAGSPVRRHMTADPVTVAPGLSVAELVEDRIYRSHHSLYPVVDGGRLTGCVTLDRVKGVPRERWAATRVSEIAAACSGDNTIAPDADAANALAQMGRTGQSRLMVVEDGRLIGILSLKDLAAVITVKQALEGDVR